jgi:hypothetical protein
MELNLVEKDANRGWGIEVTSDDHDDVDYFESLCREWFENKGEHLFRPFLQGREKTWCFFECWAVGNREQLEPLYQHLKERFDYKEMGFNPRRLKED